jgi:hypothetical protein
MAGALPQPSARTVTVRRGSRSVTLCLLTVMVGRSAVNAARAAARFG